MSEAEKTLPGVTLEFQKMEEVGNSNGKKVRIQLLARIENEETWERAKVALQQGIRLFGGKKDMATQLNEALREENNKYERRISVLEAELREEREKRDVLTDEIKQLKRALSVVNKDLGG
jgi:hypothetical protein